MTFYLSPGGEYKLRESAVPDPEEFILPEGYWRIYRDLFTRLILDIVSSRDDEDEDENPPFLWRLADEDDMGNTMYAWHVRNYRITEVPFYFIKTNDRGRPLPGAAFRLYRFEWCGDAGNYDWVHQDHQSPQTSDVDGEVSFYLTLTGEYRLEESYTPDNFWPPQGYWRVEADDAAPGGVDITNSDPDDPEFDYRPMDPDAAEPEYRLHLANIPKLFLEFTKHCDEEEGLSGATFRLYRWEWCDDEVDYIWVHIETQISADDPNAYGRVEFEYEFPQNGLYRLVEYEAPRGFVTPGGYWIITIADNVMTKTAYDGNPDFDVIEAVDEDDEDEWILANRRAIHFQFHKTNQNLYSQIIQGTTPNWNYIHTFLLPDADFSVYAWTGLGGPTPGTVPGDPHLLVCPDDVEAGYWVRIWTYTSFAAPVLGPNADYMEFWLDPEIRYFHLVETRAPDGFDLPRGQWRLTLSDDPADHGNGAPGWHEMTMGFWLDISAIADSTIPAFARNEDSSHEQFGVFYVGNRETLILPLSGGLGRGAFHYGGLLTILLALGGGTIHAKRNKLGPWSKDAELLLAEGYSCAACKHGRTAGRTQAACLHNGIVPQDFVCPKFEEP